MKRLVLLLFFIFLGRVYSQSFEATPSDEVIITSIFEGLWQKADSIVDHQISEYPEKPKYYFMKAYTAYYSRYFSPDAPARERSIDLVKHYTWKAISIGEKLEESLEINFYLGCSYAFLSRANAMSGEYWTAYWNGREAENFLEEVIEENPEAADAYLGLGVNEYYPAVAITGFTSFLAWLGGMSGDTEKGIEYFKKVANSGILFKDEAHYVLGLVYQFTEQDIAQSIEHWELLHNKYPGTATFSNFYSRARLLNLVSDKGVEFLEQNFENLRAEYSIENANVLNILGYDLMTYGEMDEALKIFQYNLKLYPDVANCYDSLAECFMNRGENQQAVKYYKMAFEKIPSDTTATEEFKERLKEGINQRLEELGSPLNS